MKQIIKVFLLSALFFVPMLFGLDSVFAQDSSGMYVSNFESEVSILPDSWLKIDEKIDVTFETEHHGIYRTIPYRYHDKFNNIRNIKIEIISIADQNGANIPYSKSYDSGKINLKIGDSNQLLTGLKQYQINYKVWGALNYFGDQTEFYWNATGDDWDMPINESKASIILLKGDCLDTTGFEGAKGSTESANIGTCTVSAKRELSNNENLTIVVRWPKNLTPPPKTGQKLINFMGWNWIYFVPLLTFIVASLVFLKFGKDPSGRGTIAPQFEPPRKMTPIEIGALIDNKAQGRDFSAMIIDFAVKGFITIEEISKKGILSTTDYALTKIKTPTGLKSFEKIIFDGLFEGRDSIKLVDLKNSFYKTKKEAEKDLFDQLVLHGFYPSSPLTAGAINYVIGFILISLGFFLMSAFSGLGLSEFSVIFSFGVSGLIIIIFGLFMSRRTKDGAIAREEILGFKLYLETAEKYRMEFYEKEKYFEKYLPYAMALGVAKIWAEKFKSIYKEGNEPDWYQGHNFFTFNAVYFASTIDSDFSTNLNTAFTSTPSSSGSSGFGGGGSSGGGFGGGGGGGW